MADGRGLVDPLGFNLAVFPGDEMPKWMYGVGLAMYDALAGKRIGGAIIDAPQSLTMDTSSPAVSVSPSWQLLQLPEGFVLKT